MRAKLLAGVACGFLALTASAPAAAHHSFAAEFDINRPIVVRGVVTRMQFSNPHAWLHVDVTTETGEVQHWQFEGGAPNALARRGWTRETLPVGIEVTVEGFQARDGAFRGSGRTITLPDGSQMFVGSTGIGAPPGTGEASEGE